VKTIGNPILAGLPDACADLFAFAIQLRSGPDPGDADDLRAQIDELVRGMEARATQSGTPAADVLHARYAIVAFLDELVLNSNWSIRDSWSGLPLQMHYFGDFAAGEEFYNRLEQVRAGQDPRRVEILDVFLACLALGFRGKFSDVAGNEKVRVMVEGLAREIQKLRGAVGELSSTGAPQATLPQLAQGFPVWIVGVGSAGLVMFAYWILTMMLQSSLSSVELKGG
jgi:type VI secretion system protein ImpK